MAPAPPHHHHPSLAQLIRAVSAARYSVMKASVPLSFIRKSIYGSIYITMPRACVQIQGNLSSYEWTETERERDWIVGISLFFDKWGICGMKFRPLIVRHYADGGSGDILRSTEQLWSFTVWRKFTCMEPIGAGYQQCYKWNKMKNLCVCACKYMCIYTVCIYTYIY